MTPPLSKYVAEFLGTFLLVFTVGCNVLMENKTWGVTSIAFVLMVGIYALGGVSGAHFNPAVTFALLISGVVEVQEAMIYIVSQLVGGILAGFAYVFLIGRSINLGPTAGYGWIEVALAEALYTFMLCFVVLNVACPTIKGNAPNQFYGIAIAFVVIAGGYGAGTISGGAFNPAVAFGIAACSTAPTWLWWSFIFSFFQLMGAAVACALHRIIRRVEFSLISILISEFLGTFFLVLTVGLNVLGKSPAGVWSIAAALMCMIYCLGDVSGAHFNPAVTLAVLLRGAFPHSVPVAFAYMATQVLGGISAGVLYSYMMSATFPLEPKPGYDWEAAAAAEVLFTFVLAFVVLAVATVEDPQCKDMFGLAIGSCVTVGGYAIGAVSGGSLNPAVSFGIAFTDAMHGGSWHDSWSNSMTYGTFEMTGGALAAVFFYGTHQHTFPGPSSVRSVHL